MKHKRQTTVDPVIEIDSHFASIQLTKPLIGMNHMTFPSGWQKQNKQETQMELSRYGQDDHRILSFLYVLLGVHIKFARSINQFLHIFHIVGWLILHWLMMYTYNKLQIYIVAKCVFLTSTGKHFDGHIWWYYGTCIDDERCDALGSASPPSHRGECQLSLWLVYGRRSSSY